MNATARDNVTRGVFPGLSIGTLDTYLTKTAIADALRAALPLLNGMVLDIGCGRQPYRDLLISRESKIDSYIGLDIQGKTDYGGNIDLVWDGMHIPLDDNRVDCAISTEVLEHCQNPAILISEAHRVIKPGGVLFLTTPFLWPLHDVPFDYGRLTPFAIQALLTDAGFSQVEIKALGGWDAALGQMIGLWVRRRVSRRGFRFLASLLSLPLVRILRAMDRPPQLFTESSMITGLSCTARKRIS